MMEFVKHKQRHCLWINTRNTILEDMLTRAVILVGSYGKIAYQEIVSEIEELEYSKALQASSK